MNLFLIGEYIPYKMEDMDWYGYEDEVTGEWICSLVVVYDPALSKMPKQRWHRALDKINKVMILKCYGTISKITLVKLICAIMIFAKVFYWQSRSCFVLLIQLKEFYANCKNYKY